MNRMTIAIAASLMAAVISLNGRAAEAPDPILAALKAEMDRTMKEMVLPDSPQPYFVSCSLVHGRTVNASASLGALERSDERQYAHVNVELRVGDYQFDNSNFSGKFMMGGWSQLDMYVAVPLDGDTRLLRRAIWWTMDQAYKRAVEQLKRKKAVVKNLSLPPMEDDFARAPALNHLEDPPQDPLPSLQVVEDHSRALSGLLKANKELKASSVRVSALRTTRWYVNSEGTQTRVVEEAAYVSASAAAQAEDGIVIGDGADLFARKYAGLPPLDDQKREIAELGGRVEAMKKAPMLEDFVGPVLFEGVAAAELAGRVLPSQFANMREPLTESKGGYGMRDTLRRKIGRRVMATDFDVWDDPTLESFQGVPLLGMMKVDYEGVKAERVSLVEKGILKTMLTTRTPDRKLPASNGHAVSGGGYGGGARAGISSLFVSHRDGVDEKKLRKLFIRAIKEQEVEYGLLVRRVSSSAPRGGEGFFSGGSSEDGTIQAPMYVFRVYRDGREELVRVLSMKGLNLPAFKDVLAAGKKLYVYNRSGGGEINTIVCPSLLFEECVVSKPEKGISKPPVLASPLGGMDRTE